MTIKLKELIYMQTMSTLAITPSGKKYWFNIEHSYSQEPAFMEMTEEKISALEATIISIEVNEGGVPVFYITEPNVQKKTITVEETTKISSEIIYIYKEKYAYALNPSSEMIKSVKETYSINVIEILPTSMYSMQIEHLAVEPTTGTIEAHIE